MTRLFRRAWRVKVDTLEVSDLDISFQVEKTTKREPNTCKLRIWNLSVTHRRQLENLSVPRGRGRIRVELEAGYVDQTALLFRGDLRKAKTVQEGADLITELEGEDGGRAVLWSRVNRSFPPGTRVDQVVRACAEAMGVGMGNAEEITRDARLAGTGATFTEGTVLSGAAADELAHILRSVGLRYSVQDGALQVLRRGQPLQATAVRLAVGTGLIGRPEVDADGAVSAQTLLVPDLYPGRLVQFDTVDLSGFYRVEKAKYSGDTFGQEWYCSLECKARS